MISDLTYYLKRLSALIKLGIRLLFYRLEYLSWRLFSRNRFENPPKKIMNVLIFNNCPLGDFLSSMKVLITVMNKNKGKSFFYALPDNLKKTAISLFQKYPIEFISHKDLQKMNFDMSILLTVPLLHKKIRKRLGFTIGNEYHSIVGSKMLLLKGIFLNRKIPPAKRHKIEQEIEIYKKAGLLSDTRLLSLSTIPSKKVESFLKKHKVRRYVVIHPAGRNFCEVMMSGRQPSLAWPLKRFSAVADYLSEKHKLHIILTGTKEERFIGEEIIRSSQNKKTFNLSGKLSVGELVYLISKSELLLSVDTSAVHAGELVDSKIIALFGPTFIEEVGAYGNKKKQINLGHPEKCIRDRKKGSSYDKENKGMCSITIEEVKKAIDILLK